MRERRVHSEMPAARSGVRHAPGGVEIEKQAVRPEFLGHTVFMHGLEMADKFNVDKAIGARSRIGPRRSATE